MDTQNGRKNFMIRVSKGYRRSEETLCSEESTEKAVKIKPQNKSPVKNRLFFTYDANRNDGDDHFFSRAAARRGGGGTLRRRDDDAGGGHLRSGFSDCWGAASDLFGKCIGAASGRLGSKSTAQRSGDSPGRDRNGGRHPARGDSRVGRREKQNFAHRNRREKRSVLKGPGEDGLCGLGIESEADRKSSGASGDVIERFHN